MSPRQVLIHYATASKPTGMRSVVLYILSLPLMALLSWGILEPSYGITPDQPGGIPLEMAFWLTCLASAFLSFFVMEVLFRRQDIKFLSQHPILPQAIFALRMRQTFFGILRSSLPMAAFWFPLSLTHPMLGLMCLGVWVGGLCLCVAVSAATIMYVGQSTLEPSTTRQAAASKFTAAPAIALAISLILVLLLKLLGEALLKPQAMDAAMTASGIVMGAFAASMGYAYVVFSRRYYAVLANFSDNDMVLLNAHYAYIDDKPRMRMLEAPSVRSLLVTKDILQFRRRHTSTMLLMVGIAVLGAIALFSTPSYSHELFLPFLAVAPYLMLVHPWHVLQSERFETGLLDTMPIASDVIAQAKRLACFQIMFPYVVMATLGLVVPMLFHGLWHSAILALVCTPGLYIASTWIMSRMVYRFGQATRPVTYLLAALFVISAFALPTSMMS